MLLVEDKGLLKSVLRNRIGIFAPNFGVGLSILLTTPY